MHKYEIILYWSEQDQAFVAEVPELPGCMAHGDTQEYALANAQEKPPNCGSTQPTSLATLCHSPKVGD